MANARTTVTETYQGNSIQCAQFVIDTVSSLFRCEPLDVNGDYAFQMVAKADASNKSITVLCGNKSHTFTLTTSWAEYSYVFEGVTVNNSYLQFQFSANGNYYIYHSKLEHGNKVTDWDEADYDIRSYAEQTADRLSWVVASGTSASNFTLTDRTAQLVAGIINLQGLITFGGLNEAIIGAVLGNNDINMLINHSSVQYTSSKVLFAYSKNYLENKSTTIEWQGNFIDVLLGIIADYNLWTSTIKGYCPSGKFDIYHIYDTTPGISDTRHHMDIWKYNNTWYQVTYNISGTNISIGTSGATTKSTLAGKASRYVCIGIVSLQKSSNNITLTDVHALKQFYKYDVDRDDFVEQNTNSTLGSILGKLCSDANMTLINGGKIATGSVDADKLNVNNLTAITANIAGFIFSQDGKNIVYTDDTGVSVDNPKIELIKDNGNPAQYGHVVYTYPNTEWYTQDATPNASNYTPYSYTCRMQPDALWFEFAQYNDVSVVASSSYFYDQLIDRTVVDITPWDETSKKGLHINILGEGAMGTNTHERPLYINEHEIWHENNLVCGHGESASISSHTGGNATITIPTDEIGSNPVINFTKYNYSDDVWLNSINTSGTSTVINVGVYNGGSSARTVKFDYMIAKHS